MDWLTVCGEGQAEGCIPTIQLAYLGGLIAAVALFALIARRSRDLSTGTLTLITVAIGINIAIGSIAAALRLPIYLDSVGTILVGALAGPWAGALTGLLANLVWAFLPVPGGAGPIIAFFAPVAAVIGLMSGFWASKGVFRIRPDDPAIGGFLALASGIGAGLMTLILIQNTVGFGFSADDPASQVRFIALTLVIVGIGLAVATVSGRTIFRLAGRPAVSHRYLVAATAITTTVLVFAAVRLLLGPTGYVVTLDDGDQAATGFIHDVIVALGRNPFALADPWGLWLTGVTAVVVGAIASLWARRGDNARFFPVWVGGITTALVATTIAVPIAAGVFGGVTGGGTDLLVALFRTIGLDVIQAVLVQSLLSDPLDKVVSFTVVLLILGAMPVTLRTMYSRGDATVSAPVAEDGLAVPDPARGGAAD